MVIFSWQVGSMDAKGYCVNIPWKNGGVGDNDYIFAFKNAVLPIGTLNFFYSFSGQAMKISFCFIQFLTSEEN